MPGVRAARSQAAALHFLIRLTPAQVGDFGVTTDRSQAAVSEGFGGEPGVAHRLLQQCPQGVAELVGVKRRDAELLGEVAARCGYGPGHKLITQLAEVSDVLGAAGMAWLPRVRAALLR